MVKEEEIINFIKDHYDGNFDSALKTLKKHKPSKNKIGRPSNEIWLYYDFYRLVRDLHTPPYRLYIGNKWYSRDPISYEDAIRLVKKDNVFTHITPNESKFYEIKKLIESNPEWENDKDKFIKEIKKKTL